MMIAPAAGGSSLTSAYGRAVVPLHHDLEPGELFSIEALASIAPQLPSAGVEHHLGDLPPLLPSGAAPQRAEPVDVVVRSVHDNGCWVLLAGLEGIDAYRAALDASIDPLLHAVAANGDAARSCELSAFVAGPDAVVPVHIDRHHNLLLQLAGHKTVWIGTYDDDAIAQHEAERRYGRDRQNPVRRPEREVPYALGPGDGLYIPPFTFHRVEGAADVSIAASYGVRSQTSEATVRVHRANGTMRRLGLHPRAVGRSAAVDGLKCRLVGVQDLVTRLIRR